MGQHLVWLWPVTRVVAEHPLHELESLSRSSRHYLAQRYFRMVGHRKELAVG
jgi:hypothetical protein